MQVTDTDTAEKIAAALAQLAVDWNLDGMGDLVQVSDQVAAFHEQGMGFGVLVKLYALANSTGIPVEQLVADFKAGTGMGELFATYGKPAKTGVGHVRQALKAGETETTDTNPGLGNKPEKTKKDKQTGLCNARAKGGKANGKGQGDVVCPP